MSILSLLDPELQVDALLETSSAKIKTRNHAAIKLMGQLGILFREHPDSGRLEPVSDIKDINTSIGNFQALLQLHFI